MLIVALVKGVPARTTKVVTVGGVLKREEMDIVLNPHDMKAIEAADYFRRAAGGKVIALSMGPDQKLAPIMRPLYESEVHGVDEQVILSDRRMAGSDTLATSYAVSLGVRKAIQRHTDAVEEVAQSIRKYGYSDAVKTRAAELYRSNLLPNRVYTELQPVTESIVGSFMGGGLTASEAVARLEDEKKRLSRFVVVTGVKTTDGETGSVGPQVAEALSEELGVQLPHATYVEDIQVDPFSMRVESERRIGYLSQRLEMELPALLTIAPDYRPRAPRASDQFEVRLNNFRGKTLQPIKWTAEDISADAQRLGLAGSPTIVGPGVEIGKPPVQKVVGRSLVFVKQVGEVESGGKKYGPFGRGDLADGLPHELVDALVSQGAVATFSLEMLAEELFA
jgi:electron transfer flavoprotein beta subunit